jgi:hypothetical protein
MIQLVDNLSLCSFDTIDLVRSLQLHLFPHATLTRGSSAVALINSASPHWLDSRLIWVVSQLSGVGVMASISALPTHDTLCTVLGSIRSYHNTIDTVKVTT